MNDKELDPVRSRLLRLLAESRVSLRTASLAIGRNAAYLHQFINRGTPKVLAEDDREILAEHLGCRPELLKHDRSVRLEARPKRPPPGLQPRARGRCAGGCGCGSLERRSGGDQGGVAVRRSAHPPRVPGQGGRPVDDRGGRGLDGAAPLKRRPHPDRREPEGAGAAGDLRDLGRIGLVAKRIEHVPHSEPPRVVLKSLNPEYDSYERMVDEIRVAGRAVLVSRKL